jgi:hypothetical protein
MDLKRIANRAKQLVDKRGGTESLKEDAAELKDIARGEGSASDKAKEAFEAIKDPGAEGADEPTQPADQPEPERDRGRGRGV